MNSEEKTFVYRPIGQLAAALAKAQGMIKGASKDTVNPHFGKAYADLASVWEACREALSKNEIAVIQALSGGPDTITVTTTLAHSSGEFVSESLTLRPTKPDPQGIGSAATYGRRYGLAAMVGVAPEDDDGNAASEPQKGRKTEQAAVKTATEQKPNEAPKLVLNLPTGEGKPFGSMTAYLDAFDTEMANVDDQVQFFDMNSATLGEMQAKAVLAKNKAGDAVAQRITEIYDRIRADTPYDPLKGA